MHSCEKFKISLLFDLHGISSGLDMGWMFVVFYSFQITILCLDFTKSAEKTQNVSHIVVAITFSCQLCDVVPPQHFFEIITLVSSLIKKYSLFAFLSFCLFLLPTHLMLLINLIVFYDCLLHTVQLPSDSLEK